ncbi:MAG TPA: HD domain-containing phosphohydrolase [Rhizobacter sp.]|nr:HD domain-containing phosphohydrolase [Rhizobacter sp.]
MDCSPLAAVKHRLKLGHPVPFNIRNVDHTLLLARGQVLLNEAQLESLLDRKAMVDAEELKGPRAEIFEAPPEELPVLWGHCIARVGRTLRGTQPAAFAQTLHDTLMPLTALIDRDPDLAIFQIVRPEALGGESSYGVAHSVHCAIATYLVSRRLGWDAAGTERVVKAALTMNMSILDLQSRLALQTMQPNAAQRSSINDHPTRSVAMLRAAGITDAIWLNAVAQHHEIRGGKGYPNALQEVSDAAALLRCVDMYTAMLSPRVSRGALPANRAGRDLFTQGDKTPIVAAVVKEFGIFPPGCFVTLQSGEAGVAIKRGTTASTPVVAALMARNGEALLAPLRRNTDVRDYAIVGVVNEASLRVRVSPGKLAIMSAR